MPGPRLEDHPAPTTNRHAVGYRVDQGDRLQRSRYLGEPSRATCESDQSHIPPVRESPSVVGGVDLLTAWCDHDQLRFATAAIRRSLGSEIAAVRRVPGHPSNVTQLPLAGTDDEPRRTRTSIVSRWADRCGEPALDVLARGKEAQRSRRHRRCCQHERSRERRPPSAAFLARQ